MKVTLDLTKLRDEGRITQAEFDKLSQLAALETGSLAFNILVGFGVLAMSGGVLALVPTPVTAIGLGAGVSALGLWLVQLRSEQWWLLAQISLLVGAILFGGGVIKAAEGSVPAFLLVAAVFAAAGVIARSGLLVTGAVLALSSAVGARTGYLHATYFLGIQEPTVTIVLFSLIALRAYQLARRLPADGERLALVVARTALFLVNFGFWIGSLWGDQLAWLRQPATNTWTAPPIIPNPVFAVTWALALTGVAIWAVGANRRWVVNVAATFGAIHFYTQCFARLGANPVAFVMAGLLTLAFAFGMRTLNRDLQDAT
jgi:iron complex transport system permease protein